MSNFSEKGTIKKNIIAGLTGAMLVGSYSISTAAVTGLGVWNIFFCIIICALFSLKLKNKILSPDAFLIMPVLYIIGKCGVFYLPITIILGTAVYSVMQRLVKRTALVNCFGAWASLCLALIVTIMLTNNYFGIGASGSTAIEMLKSYRSLGFHPHFRGLLYGTVTLFAMITYPFKFKKLNKTLPAEFMTLFVPLLLNLFLNPQREYTTVNEIGVFDSLSFAEIFPTHPASFDVANITTVIVGSIFLGVVLYLRTAYGSASTSTVSNMASGMLSFLPVRPFDIKAYSALSAIVTIAVSGVVLFAFAGTISRLPMHCAGAMLIVSVWQQVPYKNLRRAQA